MLSIKEKIASFNQKSGQSLPAFYIEFIVLHQLEKARLFSSLTTLYGIEDLNEEQTLCQQYLPSYLKVGDNGGDYGVFINTKQIDECIYICEMGDLDETSIEKLAHNFSDWALKAYDTEIFLDDLFTAQSAFKRNQLNGPIYALNEEISKLNKQLNQLGHKKSKGDIDLKLYLLGKKAIEAAIDGLKKQQVPLNTQLAEINTKAGSSQRPPITLRAIEQKFQLTLPAVYKKLEADGMLDYANAFGHDWYKRIFPALKTQPPFLMFANNFELLSLRDVYDELKESVNNETWLKDFRILPFAGDGSGDRFAFYLSTQHAPEWSIIHWWHDSDHCDILAHDLQDFIFRKMLEAAFDADAEYDLVADGDFKQNLNHWFKTHQRYLKPKHAEILAAIYQREPKNDEDGNCTLMSETEFNDVLKIQLGLDAKSESFKYC
jgi:SMI1 / KNR4 family (SUKH-1)